MAARAPGTDALDVEQTHKENFMDLLSLAKQIAGHVEAEATKTKLPVAVCVIDRHGNVVLTHRMNGAPLFSIEIAERKAYTSALVGSRTAELLPMVQPGQPLYALTMVSGGRFCAIGGGVPIESAGEVVAGAGVSGGTADEDVAIIEAALKAIAPGTPSGPT
jgi:uncharacterized protein GlcG (DUF336 family)